MTDSGKEYLQSCRRALRTLKDGGELLEGRRTSPNGTRRYPRGAPRSTQKVLNKSKELIDRLEKDLRTGRDERLAAVAGVARANSPMLVVLSGSQPYPRIEIEVSHRLRFPFPTAQGR